MLGTKGTGSSPINWPAILVLSVSIALLSSPVGCVSTPPRSTNYFALEPGNEWLYEGVASFEGQQLTADAPSVVVEIEVVEPDPSLVPEEGTLDMTIDGSFGSFRVSEEGLFLEAKEYEVRLWGIREAGAKPRLFKEPYVWLERPLEVGERYNTAIQGKPTPAVMEVTAAVSTATPWGEMDGYLLVEKNGSGDGVELTFVPHLGFTRIVIPGLSSLELQKASLR